MLFPFHNYYPNIDELDRMTYKIYECGIHDFKWLNSKFILFLKNVILLEYYFFDNIIVF